MTDGPLLVFGPRSLAYDFGPGHPLTPLRFGPGIDLLRTLGAEPGLAPEPASDEELALCHDLAYISAVRRFSVDPERPAEAGIGQWGDNPAFEGMHDASASVARGSIDAMATILRGDVEHAFHPGGGLHHAMRARASGFCIYDDPALAIALARAAGLRVLYVDLDVHHGDGVQTLHADDPGVMTISIHESGRGLFPGTGFVDEIGDGAAAGSIVNVPLEPATGEGPWLEAVRMVVSAVAAAFGPDVVVSQHGSDTHAWDPLAHLRVTTTAIGEAARLVDAIAHRFAGGRWLSTGGGGYDAYRVVPRAWSHVWLAGAHRAPPESTGAAWRERWTADAERFGTPGMPDRFDDAPNAGLPIDRLQTFAASSSREVIQAAVAVAVPALIRAAIGSGWDPLSSTSPRITAAAADGEANLVELTPAILERLSIAHQVVPVADAMAASGAVRTIVGHDGSGVAAVAGDVIVGLGLVARRDSEDSVELVALGVAPDRRGSGLGGAILRRLAGLDGPRSSVVRAVVGPAERDVRDPWPLITRQAVGRSILTAAGFRELPGTDLPHTIGFERSPGS